ncbi:hypothetical protein [Steroidobacter sp.]|uniref:hypothetical protein n=1 Tax=Steroidobacter sp. TaxID=1978227 RepID=UPI001A4F54A1|nr:hypothetical protein [Steroidobacter sp.]MBL8270834.1 hypothetical protein [Steroidobacter sp.]
MSSLVIRTAVLSCIAIAGLSACNRGGDPAAMLASEPAELSWARAALERNPRYEVLASDIQTRVFTVRDRITGQVQTLNLNDLAAAPIAQLRAPTIAPAPEPVAPPVAATASTPPAPAVAQPAAPAPAAPPTSPAAPEDPAQLVDSSPAAAAERAQAAESNYTIDRSGGQLRVSGPGVSIVSSGPRSASASANTTGARPAEPIICEGKRLLKLDDRNIYVDGDAIIARGGCELYITNSRVVASGTGLIVEDAIVHVANSHIEGLNGSFNATDRAKMFVRTSTFQGVPRRAEFASVLDQGGNQWR